MGPDQGPGLASQRTPSFPSCRALHQHHRQLLNPRTAAISTLDSSAPHLCKAKVRCHRLSSVLRLCRVQDQHHGQRCTSPTHGPGSAPWTASFFISTGQGLSTLASSSSLAGLRIRTLDSSNAPRMNQRPAAPMGPVKLYFFFFFCVLDGWTPTNLLGTPTYLNALHQTQPELDQFTVMFL